MNTLKLGDIAVISPGFVLRTALRPVEEEAAGAVRVIGMQDIRRGAGGQPVILSSAVHADFSGVSGYDGHRLAAGDLVMPTRGKGPFLAAVVDEKFIGAVPMSTMSRLRIKDTDRVSAGYLRWFLSEELAQAYFLKNAQGSVMPFLTSDLLRDLPVPVPGMAEQQKLMEFSELCSREAELNRSINTRRMSLLSAALARRAEEEAQNGHTI